MVSHQWSSLFNTPSNSLLAFVIAWTLQARLLHFKLSLSTDTSVEVYNMTTKDNCISMWHSVDVACSKVAVPNHDRFLLNRLSR